MPWVGVGPGCLADARWFWLVPGLHMGRYLIGLNATAVQSTIPWLAMQGGACVFGTRGLIAAPLFKSSQNPFLSGICFFSETVSLRNLFLFGICFFPESGTV